MTSGDRRQWSVGIRARLWVSDHEHFPNPCAVQDDLQLICCQPMAVESLPIFRHLSPDLVIRSIESSFDLRLSGVLTPYSSYINRVYGVEGEDADRFVVKYYRPGRWSEEAIMEEHRFLTECEKADIPVAAPIASRAGKTLHSVLVDETGESYRFALFRQRGGRQFDAERKEDWLRLGSLVARVHTVGRSGKATHRTTCTPDRATRAHLSEIKEARVVHPDLEAEFFDLADEILDVISPSFEGVRLQRIHGDCHRGNILERPGEGLMLIDFDDMMVGPTVQDLWLLLPDHTDQVYAELELLIEGYEQFATFERNTLSLIEPLRFMRMIHYLAWSARQRTDTRFLDSFPDWGGKAFWIKEIEDLRQQGRHIAAFGSQIIGSENG